MKSDAHCAGLTLFKLTILLVSPDRYLPSIDSGVLDVVQDAIREWDQNIYFSAVSDLSSGRRRVYPNGLQSVIKQVLRFRSTLLHSTPVTDTC